MREHLVKWAAAAAVAVGLLVGNVAPAGAAEVPVEGPFSGPGSFVNDPCARPDDPPDWAPIGTAFEATGTLSSLGPSEIDLIACLSPVTGGAGAFGPLTVSTADGTLTGDMEGTVAVAPGAPIGGPFVMDMTATLTGGTGDFEGASGTLAVQGTFTLGPFVVNGTIGGTITLPPHTPTSKDDCKHGGWRNFEDENGEPFRNQRACIRWVEDHT